MKVLFDEVSGLVGDSLSVPATWGSAYMDVIVASFVNRTLYHLLLSAAWTLFRVSDRLSC